MKKRLIPLFLSLVLMLGLLPARSMAAPTASGECGAQGSNLTWRLEDGLLTVSGSGEMAATASWFDYRDSIRRAVLEEGVASVGIHVFDGCENMVQLDLPASLREFGLDTLQDCENLASVTMAPDNPYFQVADGALIQTLDHILLYYPPKKNDASFFLIPDGVQTLVRNAFQHNASLQSIGVPASLRSGLRFLTDLPRLSDVYYEGTRQQWEKMVLSDGDLTVHCNRKLGAPLPPLSALRPLRTANLGRNDYYIHSAPMTSFLRYNGDNTLTRVEELDGKVFFEQYDHRGLMLEQRIVAACDQELPIFGSCYLGEDRNFLVFGQANPDESDETEVIRVVSYSKDWERLGDTRICGANTSFPLLNGSVRMLQVGDYLYIRTNHQMYKTSDGLNHQANVMLNIHVPTMELRDHLWSVASLDFGYVSHSFNQFLTPDQDAVVALDHGDGYPRSVVAIRYPYKAGQDKIIGPGLCACSDMLSISGKPGENHTGVCVGGFEASDRAYLAAGNTVDQTAGDLFAQRNIFLSALPKDQIGRAPGKPIMLTHYTEADGVEPLTPALVKLNGDSLLVLWTELRGRFAEETLCWQFVDGAGTPVGPVYSDERGALSDCQPIVKDGSVLWYFTDFSMPVFCSIDPAHPETLNLQKADFPKPDRSFYTVTVDGQTYADIEEGSVLANLLPQAPEKPDHRFLGWFHGENRVDRDTVVHSDMVLVPRWEESFPTCTVTVDGVVHSGVRVGTPLADLLPELPEKSGHSLVWMEGGSVVELSATVRRDMVLTHSWVFDVFNDVGESDWYYNGVKYTTFRGLFRGVSPVSFGPAVKMNRAMVVQVLYSMAGKPPVAKTHQFNDVKDSDWFAEAVAWAVENGVASGYGGGQFGSEDVINREQLAVMLHGYAKKPAAQGGLSFADEADISLWARNAMQWAVENHIMSGVGGNRISPQTTASRAEAAVMIMQFHKLMTQ